MSRKKRSRPNAMQQSMSRVDDVHNEMPTNSAPTPEIVPQSNSIQEIIETNHPGVIIAVLQGEISRLQGLLATSNREFTTRAVQDGAIHELQKKLIEKDSEIVAISKRLEAKDIELVDVKQLLTSANTRIAELEKEISGLVAQNASLNDKLNSMNARLDEMQNKIEREEIQLQLCHYIAYFEDTFVLPQVNSLCSTEYNCMQEFYNAMRRTKSKIYHETRRQAWKSLGFEPLSDNDMKVLLQYRDERNSTAHPGVPFDMIDGKKEAHADIITVLARKLDKPLADAFKKMAEIIKSTVSS